MSVVKETLEASHPGVCGAVGCHKDLKYVARHEDRGEIYVCEDHAKSLEILRLVMVEEVSQ